VDIIDLAVHGVVRQKSDFHGNSDIHNSQKLDPLEITAIKISGQNRLDFQRYFVAKIDPWCITKSRISYTYAIGFV
jgi:hypothetical protein